MLEHPQTGSKQDEERTEPIRGGRKTTCSNEDREIQWHLQSFS